jgi:ribonuclease HI
MTTLHPQLPVGGRLQKFVEGWGNLTEDHYILRLIAEGYQLQFVSLPPLTSNPREVVPPKDLSRLQALTKQVLLLEEKQAIQQVDPKTLGFYSHVFVVPKNSGDWRLVIDLKSLNSHIEAPHFKMSTVAVVLNTLRPGDWAFKLDLQDAYLHVPIHPKSQKYLRFAFQGKVYQFRALPFGLNVAPLVFTKLVHTLAAHLHSHGVSLLPYLDDWIVHHPDPQVLLDHRTLVMQTLEKAGFLINLPKSELVPTQDIQFLGIRFQLDRGIASIPPERIESTVQLARRYSRPTDHPPSVRLNYHQVASLLGSLNWVSTFVPLGRLRLRPLQLLFQQVGLLNRQSPPAMVDRVSLTRCLQCWCDPQYLASGIPIREFHPDHTMFTDASTHGWGAHMQDMELSGTWSTQEASLHINCLELKAIINALKSWIPYIKGSQVMVATDNTSVVAYINKQGGTHSRSLLTLTQELLLWLNTHEITLRARHIPGRFNVIADRLSRSHQVLHSEWQLHPMVLYRVFSQWGIPQVDMFATVHNAQLPQFVSPVPDPRAMAVDALSLSWENRWMYMFPPFPVLTLVMQKLQATQQAELILIAPWWPSQAWFPHLLRLCVEHPWKLPRQSDLLTQPGDRSHNGDRFHLHAWRLSRNTCKQKAFLQKLLQSQQNQDEPLQAGSMMVAGVYLSNGLRNRGLIHSLPLPLN